VCVDLKELNREIFREQRRYNNTIKALALQVEVNFYFKVFIFCSVEFSPVFELYYLLNNYL
jgi:hypothetical protein